MLCTFLLCALVVLVAVALWLLFRRWTVHRLRTDLGYTGPPASLWLGNLPEIARLAHSDQNNLVVAHRCFDVWQKRYGDVYAYFRGPVLTVVVHDLDLIQDIHISKFSCFTDRTQFMLRTWDPAHDSILMTKGGTWKGMRTLVSPIFTALKMRSVSEILQETTDLFLAHLARSAGESIDIYELCEQLTADTICHAALGVPGKALHDDSDVYLIHSRRLMKHLNLKTSPFFLSTLILPEFDLLFSAFRRFMSISESETALYSALERVFRERKAVFDPESTETDLIQLLLKHQCKNPSFTDHQIISNMYVLLEGGYETTSVALACTAWLLAKHPAVMKRLQEEVDQVCRGELFTYDKVMNELPYLDAVFRETLRLYPTTPGFQIRRCTRACDIRGYKFQPGMEVFVPTYQIQHSSDNWFEPEIFKPDRFLTADHHPMAWLPFGAGPRNCVGLRFAELVIPTWGTAWFATSYGWFISNCDMIHWF